MFWWWFDSENQLLVKYLRKAGALTGIFRLAGLTIGERGGGKGAEGNMDWNNTCQTSLETYQWSSLFIFTTYYIYYIVNWNPISYVATVNCMWCQCWPFLFIEFVYTSPQTVEAEWKKYTKAYQTPRNFLEFMAGGGLIPGEYIWFCIAQEMEVCVIFHKQLGVCVVAVSS